MNTKNATKEILSSDSKPDASANSIDASAPSATACSPRTLELTEAEIDILQEFEILDTGKNSTFFPRFSSFSSFFRQILCGTKPVSSFKNFTEEEHEQVLLWLRDHSIPNTRELIALPVSEGGMGKTIGTTSIWRYRRNYLAAYLALLNSHDLDTATKTESSAVPSDSSLLDTATLRALRHLLFAMVLQKADPLKIRALYSVFQKFADQQLTERRVELLEQKAALYEKAKAALQNPDFDPKTLKIDIEKFFGV
jgi:hypothetical protein